jgi:hypothetical protein
MNVQFSPPSVLLANPQLVPTKMCAEFCGSKEIPNAEGSFTFAGNAQNPAGGLVEAGLVQLTPPSWLTLMPAKLFTRPS